MVRNTETVDWARVLKLRLVVARFGEMDKAKWWNTNGQLGRLGTAALRRGFPRTHFFAQARSVFAVAAHRCDEIFPAPDSVTLWRLPADLEEEFDGRWVRWLGDARTWAPVFEKLEDVVGTDLVAALREFEVVAESDVAALGRLRRSDEGRSVALREPFQARESDFALLALGFALGETGKLTLPYARRDPT